MAAKNNLSAGYPGQIRIIGGRWRSRIIDIANESALRPTPNRVRETVFNWLSPWLSGSTCLDLSAGTGILCFEALSRSAAAVVMVDNSIEAIKMINRNIEKLAADSATVVHQDAIAFLQGEPKEYDIIFLDPPFRSDLISQCASLIDQKGWLKMNGLVYIEAPSTMITLPVPDQWQLLKSKQAGQVGYHLLQRSN